MSTKNKLGMAIFGLGRAGMIHLKGICRNPKADLKWVIEERLDYGRSALDKFGVGKEVSVIQYVNSQTVFDDESVGAILICTPTDMHEEIVRRGLQAGKAVFCEKPLALSLEKISACYEMAEKCGKPLLCAFNRRFDPTVRSLKNRARQGDIGQLQCVKTVSRDAPLPPISYLKISGGIFHDCGVHDIDLICWIMDEEPESVFVQAHAFHEGIAEMNDVDQVLIVMKFPSGALSSTDLSRHAVYGYDQRLEAFGSKGMLEQENSRLTSLVMHSDSGSSYDCIHDSFPTRYELAYENELEHFINVALGIEEKLDVTKEETLRASLVAEACEESWHSGKLVIMKDFKETRKFNTQGKTE